MAEQVWSEHRGQVYLAGCAECAGQNAQSFVVDVEGNETTSVRSSELSGGFTVMGRD